MIEPDEEQYKALKAAFKLKTSRTEYLEELKEQEKNARELFEFVMIEHPRTPWARRGPVCGGLSEKVSVKTVFWTPRPGLPIRDQSLDGLLPSSATWPLR